MPSSDYIASSGALKLKGAAGVTKSKKKKKPKAGVAEGEASKSSDVGVPTKLDGSIGDAENQVVEDFQDEKAAGRVKTEAELRYEEKKRKRLEDRLNKDGTKTHKERVEDLNRYLSGLSEHHDMPRIGPG